MPDIADVAWSERDDRNSEPVPAGWPQGSMPAYVDQTGRMMMAATKRFWNKINPTYQTSGTGDAYVVQTEASVDHLNLFELLTFRIDRSNVGTTPSLQIGSTNPRTIVKAGASGYVPLAAGDMYAGNDHSFWYNGGFYVLSDPVPSAVNIGAVASVVAGTGIGVDGTDPQHPIVTNNGVRSVVAGTNIAVNATDPRNPVVAINGQIPVANGGTGQPTAQLGFDALSPTTTRGDVIFRNATTNARLAASTAGYLFQTNGAGADPSWVGYTQGGTGSLTRSWQAWNQDRISILDFTGVDPTGVSDSRAGIVAADAAAAALGKALYFPSGNYLVSAAITPSSFATWIGESRAKVVLKTTSATGNLLTVSNGYFTLDRISFGTTVTRTAGSYIDISASVVYISNFDMTGTFQGIFLSAAVSTVEVYNGNISTSSSSSIGLRLHGGVAIQFANLIVVWNGVAHPFACLYIDNGGDYSFTNCQFLAGTNGGQITPAAGQSVAYCRFTNCWFDTSLGAGLSITPTSTGAITGCDFVQCWFSSSGTYGVQFAPGASASVTNMNFANCFIINNAVAGVGLTGVAIADCNFINNTVNGPGATAGFSLNTSVSRIRIQGNRIGGHLYGIFSDGTPTDAMIYDNSFVACTNKIAGAWLGNTRIERNAGYNPVGAAGITPGASPYTYTAGPSPETVYTSASTSITAATQGGVSILPAASGANASLCIQLEPNEAVVITYTGTLTARKMVH